MANNDLIANNVLITGGLADGVQIGTKMPATGIFDSLIARGRTFLTQYTTVGGELVVAMGEGSTVTAMAAADVTFDFGRPLTANDWIMIRSTNSEPYEYIKLGAVVSGSLYNITRAEGGTTARDWPVNSIWILLGHSGDGRLVLSAHGVPTYKVIEQGATADASTVRTVLGNITGLTGIVGTKWGLWTDTGYFLGEIHATSGTIDGELAIGALGSITVDTDSVVIDKDGVTLLTSDTIADLNALKWMNGAVLCARLLSYYGGGWTSLWLNNYGQAANNSQTGIASDAPTTYQSIVNIRTKSGTATGKIILSHEDDNPDNCYLAYEIDDIDVLRITGLGNVLHSNATGLTAGTTHSQAGATPLTKDLSEVTVCANASDAIKLPSAAAGMQPYVKNSGAQACAVWPASGDNVMGAGVDAVSATTIAAGKTHMFMSWDATNWHQIVLD